jgi:hypothetical protein
MNKEMKHKILHDKNDILGSEFLILEGIVSEAVLSVP